MIFGKERLGVINLPIAAIQQQKPKESQEAEYRSVGAPFSLEDNDIGYGMRAPSESELDFFQKTPNVSGMATEDGMVIFNPTWESKATTAQKRGLYLVESARLYMREDKSWKDIKLTPEQENYFRSLNDPYYSKLGDEAKQTLVSRIIGGDRIKGADFTKEQIAIANKVSAGMIRRNTARYSPPKPEEEVIIPNTDEKAVLGEDRFTRPIIDVLKKKGYTEKEIRNLIDYTRAESWNYNARESEKTRAGRWYGNYYGRGPFQITGEKTYRELGRMLNLDLVSNPDLVLNEKLMPRVAAAYIEMKAKEKGLSKLDLSSYRSIHSVWNPGEDFVKKEKRIIDRRRVYDRVVLGIKPLFNPPK